MHRTCSTNAKTDPFCLSILGLNLHRLEIGRDLERCFGLGPDLVDGDTLSVLDQCQSLLEVHVEHRKLGDDAADAGATGEGKGAFYCALAV